MGSQTHRKNTLILKDYWGESRDLQLKVWEGFELQTKNSTDGKVKKARLTVWRKPDKHSSSLGMFAYLHNNEDGYQNLGFTMVSLVIDEFSAADKFLSRTILDLPNAKVDSSLVRGDDEELVFVSNSFKEFKIAKVEFIFD